MPTLSEADSKRVLASHGVTFPSEREVADADAAVSAARELGHPVVLKLGGAAIAHKTERGLVRLGLGDDDAVAEAARDLLAAATPEDGEVHLLVAPMLRGNRELIAGLHLEHSFLGRMGKAIEPVVRPLGWDWKLGCAAIASFPAREVIVATLGVIYNLGEGQDEESPELKETLKAATWDGTDRPVFNIPVALSVMVFFALCAQCASTLAVIKRETGGWRWMIVTFLYMLALAYIAAFITYRIALALGWG